jgi:GMP synthase (glutamine-hydrolysing)
VPRALVLSHDWIAHELGHLEPWLDDHGFAVTRAFREDPRPLPAADLLIVMGSPGSVADGGCPPASQGEIATVQDWVESGRPCLGICFGAQVLALAGGGAVRRMPVPFEDYAELDVAAGAPEPLRGPWVVWHNDGIAAPADASVLGSLDHADLVLRTRRAWGVQPHVEVTAETLERMAIALGSPPTTYGPIVDRLRADEDANASRARALLDAFLDDTAADRRP